MILLDQDIAFVLSSAATIRSDSVCQKAWSSSANGSKFGIIQPPEGRTIVEAVSVMMLIGFILLKLGNYSLSLDPPKRLNLPRLNPIPSQISKVPPLIKLLIKKRNLYLYRVKRLKNRQIH